MLFAIACWATQFLKSCRNKSFVNHFRIFFTELEVFIHLQIKVCQEWSNNIHGIQGDRQTNVENVVNYGSCKDLEAQKKIEETCQEAEHSLSYYQEHGKIKNAGTYNILIPAK